MKNHKSMFTLKPMVEVKTHMFAETYRLMHAFAVRKVRSEKLPRGTGLLQFSSYIALI